MDVTIGDIHFGIQICHVVAGVLFTVILIVVTIYNLKSCSVKTGKPRNTVLGLENIPGPKPSLPTKLIGNIPQLLPYTNFLPQLLKWEKTFSEMCIFYGLYTPCVCLGSPHVIQQYLKSTDFGHGVKSPLVYDKMKPFIQNGLLVSKGNQWKQNRKILMRTQNVQNLKAYMTMLNKHAQQFSNDLEETFQDGMPHTVNTLISTRFLRIVCEMITGSNIKISITELHRYHQNLHIWKECLVKRILYPWLLLDFVWKLCPSSKLLEQGIQEMFDFAKRRIQDLKDNQTDEIPVFRSFLDELVNPQTFMDNKQIVDEVNTIIFAGHETGATALHFFCLMMALNPHQQQLCQQEIDQLFESHDYLQKSQVSYQAATSGLKYLQRCLQETMRLYPPVFMIFRQLESPLTIQTETNQTYLLLSGCNVVVCPYELHRNSKYYPNPDIFDPDRFLPENIGKRPSCSYIPFSAGPRSCLASKFVMIELKIMAAYMLRNFTISTNTKLEHVKLLPFTTLTAKKDFEFRFSKR